MSTAVTNENSSTPTTIALPVLEGSEYDKYMLRAPQEVFTLLRQLQERITQLTVFCNDGQDMLLTVLLNVTPERLILDIGPDENVNQRIAVAEKHYCIGQLDRVRIQFLLGPFTRVGFEHRPAFQAALPKEVLRLQRREYYRLRSPVARPLKCRLSLPPSNGGIHFYEAKILDISVGGVGLDVPEDLLLEVGQIIPHCRIELPEVGIVEGTLRICQMGVSFTREQARRRAGCEFVELPGPQQTLIQRYIIKVERERKARESGLGF
ncbi:flagellar brake protein [Sulfuricystis multivorans]|uniref:flagellar brake protein n=1 Tax=Sulfuricystis multivorans TaxID=2211108 RepID=UPI000F82C21F|nr:flagellar brake protein [Sulfuricystis multivorans]